MVAIGKWPSWGVAGPDTPPGRYSPQRFPAEGSNSNKYHKGKEPAEREGGREREMEGQMDKKTHSIRRWSIFGADLLTSPKGGDGWKRTGN
jgi:hypothetical protein